MPKEYLKLYCAAKDLEKKDGIFRKSDPFVSIRTGTGKLVGKSEIIEQNLYPTWKPFLLDVTEAGGRDAKVTISVSDWDPNGNVELIGSFSVTIAQLVQQPNQDFPLIGRKRWFHSDSGKFNIVKYEEITKDDPSAYSIKFSAKGLPRMDGLFGKSDPFLVFYAQPENHKNEKSNKYVISKSKIIRQNLNPEWDPIILNYAPCGLDNSLIIEVYDWDDNGSLDYIGEVKTTIRELVHTTNPFFPIINQERRVHSGSYQNSGFLRVDECEDAVAIRYASRYRIQFKAGKLANMDWFSKSDPFFKIISQNQRVVYQSEVIKNNLDPIWNSFEIDTQSVDGLDTTFTVEIWDYDSPSKSDFIGKMNISLRELTFFEITPGYRLLDPSKPKSFRGFLRVEEMTPLNLPPLMPQPSASQIGLESNNNYPPMMNYPPGVMYPSYPVYPPSFNNQEPGLEFPPLANLQISSPNDANDNVSALYPNMQPYNSNPSPFAYPPQLGGEFAPNPNTNVLYPSGAPNMYPPLSYNSNSSPMYPPPLGQSNSQYPPIPNQQPMYPSQPNSE